MANTASDVHPLASVLEDSRNPGMKRGKKRPKGRSGGRGGASGYDFQDLYVAFQLAHLLVQSRSNPPVEVSWEKKAFDTGAGEKPLPLLIEDVVLVLKSGKRIHVEVKETAPSGKWTIQKFCSSGLATQFWQAWENTPQQDRGKVALRLASASDLSPVNLLLDLARRSRTPAELKSEEGASEAQRDLKRLARSLAVEVSDPQLLEFLKSLEGKQLPDSEELEGLIADALAAFGSKASEAANHLIRLVARSKHTGATARSSFTRESLASAMRESGADDESLISIGALQADTSGLASDWNRYRRKRVRELRSMRVYGLQVQKTVNADLLTLFVPLRFSRIVGKEAEEKEEERPPRRRSFLERLLEERRSSDEVESSDNRHQFLPLGELLKTEKRFALVGGPGTGKTTVLKWLTVVSALPGEEGRKVRLMYGLPRKPLTPIYVRFRELVDRILQRGLQGVRWRAGLVSDFLAAQFEAGLLETAPSRQEAVAIAQTALQSEETFLLLDGLDEIPDEGTRTKLFMAVDDLMQTYDKPRFALSWRPYALSLDEIPSDIPLFGPQFFNFAELRTFAKNWYSSIRPELGKEAMSAEDSKSRAEDLARAAIEVCELAECPLLYSILALIHFNKQGLPVDRTSLYDQATLAMLGHWERDPSGRGLGSDSFPGWSSELPCKEGEIRTLVERLAYRIQCREGGNEFSTDSAVEALAEGLSTDFKVDQQAAASHAGLLLQLLIERSGLILEKSPGVLAFVHRSFQEYLAARWFAARGSPGSKELKSLASDEMHSEVVQFCVAIMAEGADQAEKTRIGTLLGEIGHVNPAVAAACLVETPDLELAEETAQDLGRAVWSECSSMFRRHYPPQATSRLVWACLNRISDPDQLLLELLSDHAGEGKMRHGSMESSMAVLFSRPTDLPLSDRLRWVLTRMSKVKEGWELIHAQRGLACLLLVENGAEPTANLVPIFRLLGEQFWWRRRGRHAEDPSSRAERIINSLLSSPDTREEVLEALRSSLLTTSERSYWRGKAARILVLEGDPLTGTVADALVEIRTYDEKDQQETADFIQKYVEGQGERELIGTAIQRKLEDASPNNRKAYYALARDSGIQLSGLPLPSADLHNEAERVAQICSLLSEESTKTKTLEAVADQLWEENSEIAWQAALALLQTRCFETPGLPQALVRHGLGNTKRRSRAFRELTKLHGMRPVSLSVRSALLEGLRSESDFVAAGSARLLLDFASGRDRGRLSRIIEAGFRDWSLLDSILPHFEKLLGDPDDQATFLRAVGEYLDKGKVKLEVASRVSIFLAKRGYMKAPHLALGLVHGGLAKESRHDEVIPILIQMLDDRELVANTRKALTSGLQSKHSTVSWGAARCLWESGNQMDPGLAGALIRVGLGNRERRASAHAWLLELFSRPATASKVRSNLEAASQSFATTSNDRKDTELAWDLARCLIAAKLYYDKNLAHLLVWGALSRRERQEEGLAVIQRVRKKVPPLFEPIREQLFRALEIPEGRFDSGLKTLSQGAALALTAIEEFLPRHPVDEEDSETIEFAASHLKALLQQDSGAVADGLGELLEGDTAELYRKALNHLLEDKDAGIAFEAARRLLALGESPSAALARAVTAGLAKSESFQDASQVLDQLQSDEFTKPLVMEGIHLGLWGTDREIALGAARYMLDRGEKADWGVARGLVFGALRYGFFEDWKLMRRLDSLLHDPDSRPAVLNALVGAFHTGHSGERFFLVSLILRAGGALNDPILFEMEKAMRRWPLAPFCLLALTNNVAKAQKSAKRLDLEELSRVLEE